MSPTTQQERALIALIAANHVRSARARDRRLVRSQPGHIAAMLAIAGLLNHPHKHLETLRLEELLAWVKHSHPATRARLIEAAGASDAVLVGQLTYRQRAAIVAELDDRYGENSMRKRR